MNSRKTLALVLVIAFIGSAFGGYFLLAPKPGGGARSPGECAGSVGDGTSKAQLSAHGFGAVTLYQLPQPGRLPNAITAAPDGSIWFGEQSVPGLGHLYQNGTLIQYPWPVNSTGSSSEGGALKTLIWGIAVWNGSVWATDAFGNRLVGLNPCTGATRTVDLPGSIAFPYALTVGPDGSLWFGNIIEPPTIGRLDVNGQLHLYRIASDPDEVPAQIAFVNSTTAYFVALNPAAGLFPGRASGSVNRFDPSHIGTKINATRIGPHYPLAFPNSISVSNGSIWVAQHGASAIATYNAASGTWMTFPTSRVAYADTTLPYFVEANVSLVWFNEHFGNRIAMINATSGELTEYSVSDPPASNGFEIDSALTIALERSRVWFTELTGNSIGFVDAGRTPSSGISMVGSTTVKVKAGGSINIFALVKGNSSLPLQVRFSDSEDFTAKLQAIFVNASTTSIPLLDGEQKVAISLYISPLTRPGNYTLLISVSDGLVTQSAFLAIELGA